MGWLIKYMTEERKSWGHHGGETGHIIMKCDGEASVVAVREAVAKHLGGTVVPEQPPRSESQSNGAVENACRTVKDFTRVLKAQIEDKAHMKLDSGSVVAQ